MLDKYPQRPSHFAHKFTRLIYKTCLAQEIGRDACFMLVMIAHTEDASHYSRPVTFYNKSLMDVCGFNSEKQLINNRNKAIQAGWLNYCPGKKGKAGVYWVIIPPQFQDRDDLPTSEDFDHDFNTNEQTSGVKNGSTNAVKVTGKAEGKTQGKWKYKRSESDSHSSLSLPRTQNPDPDPLFECDFDPVLNESKLESKTVEMCKQFSELYPKKIDFNILLTHWRSLFIEEVLFETIINHVKRMLLSPDWLKEGGRYVASPIKYLSERRWNNSTPALFNPNGEGSTNGHQKKSNFQIAQEQMEARKNDIPTMG